MVMNHLKSSIEPVPVAVAHTSHLYASHADMRFRMTLITPIMMGNKTDVGSNTGPYISFIKEEHMKSCGRGAGE